MSGIGLDVRLPIGLMFSLLGAVLVTYGVIGDPAVYARSLGYNVNLVWGGVLLAFGALVLYLGLRARSRSN
jgi:hypothetical protein